MSKAALAPEADVAGYAVFKLGGAGTLLGSLAWLRRSAETREADFATRIAPQTAILQRSAMAERPRVSAFRATPKIAR